MSSTFSTSIKLKDLLLKNNLKYILKFKSARNFIIWVFIYKHIEQADYSTHGFKKILRLVIF